MNSKSSMTLGRSLFRMACGAIAAMGLTEVAIADCYPTSCNDIRILELYTPANSDTYVRLSGTLSTLNCSLVSGTYVTLVGASQHYKEIYATLLAAQLAERSVTVRIDTGSAGCTIQYITLSGT